MQTTGGQNVRKEGGRAGCLSTLLPDFHTMPHSAKRHGMRIRVTVSALLFRRFGKPRRPSTCSLGPLLRASAHQRRGPPNPAANPADPLNPQQG